MKQKNRKIKRWLPYIIGVVLLIGMFIYFTPLRNTVFITNGQEFNNGGRFVFDIKETDLVGNSYDIEKDISILYDTTLTIYAGTGWDNKGYIGLVTASLYKDEVLQDTYIVSLKREYENTRHDADKKNIPASYPMTFTIPLGNLDNGNYKVVFHNMMTGFNDNTEFGKMQGIWNEAIKNTNEVTTFEENSDLWMETFSQQAGIKTNYLKSEKFTVTGRVEEEEPPVNEPIEYMKYLPYGIGIMVLILIVIAYFRLKGKKKR